ncbi:MAG: DNA polymerase III, alpha subunit [Candidatus Xenolissoclinum pacificiensis L6]|uniref:DNA polymerase III subunit alpha n=1 Tax=Candidatus Xenolissoclinum pacificiensis L6 TaxID=1401685 RepID=W2UZN0_9RICK|nr:MAG: DNA polymerase III, alpha subunit [Candidatus Xenolissoclinum pacificiensis L6]
MQEYKFVHLSAHSDYSMLKSTLKIQDLISLALENNMSAIALTDYNNLSGSLEFSIEAIKAKIKPIIGCDINILYNNFVYPIQLLALNNEGFYTLGEITSKIFNNCQTYPVEKIKNHKNLICIAKNTICTNPKFLQSLLSVFKTNLYMGIERYGTTEEQNSKVVELAYKYNIPIVAINNIFFKNKEQFKAYNVLKSIEGNTNISDNLAEQECYFKSHQEMIDIFYDLPEAIYNTVVIARRCTVILEKRPPTLPLFTEQDEEKEITLQAQSGLQQKFINTTIPAEYQERLKYELNIITSMQYSGYFLIVSDFIKWSKHNNVPVGPGRGSGVGSLVAWCLEITDLDPLEYDLIFERFLNPQRISMPDFDIDFCQEKRPLVIEYIRKKYGHIAHIVTFGKLQARAVIKDVSRVLKIPYSISEHISKMIPHDPINPVTLQQAIDHNPELQKYLHDELTSEMMKISVELEGRLRHVSVHAAGIVISSEPLMNQLPIYYDDTLPNPVTQYSMKYVEFSGLVKFDFLGLKTLTIITNIVQQIKPQLAINAIPMNDPKTFQLLSSGKSVGIFQLESSFMYETLRNAKPDTIEDIIALISLNRPGPMENIPSYINRKHHKEKIEYLHPMLLNILYKTFGVIIYQEQVMEIAKQLSGYTMADADLLRRAMGKKITSEMDEQQMKFIEGATKNNINIETAEKIFQLVAKFAGYGFNKSHAAAYALISYQTAYLKANYTIEFLIENMNIDIQDSDRLLIFCNEARNFGIEILPPDINLSKMYFSLENEKIRFGLLAIKGIGHKVAEMLSRMKYNSMMDFVSALDNKIVNKKSLSSLIKSGAFDNLELNQNKLLSSVEVMLQYGQIHQCNQLNLFQEQETFKLIDSAFPSIDEKNSFEYESLGFYYFNHPLKVYMDSLTFDDNIVPVILLSYTLKSKNNEKFAFLKLNSINDLYSLPIYGTKKVHQYQSLLVKNNRLLMVTDNDRKRLISIHNLDNYILGQSGNNIEIIVESVNAISEIKKCISKDILYSITIIKKYPDKELKFQLPGKYKIDLSKLLYVKDIQLINHHIKQKTRTKNTRIVP